MYWFQLSKPQCPTSNRQARFGDKKIEQREVSKSPFYNSKCVYVCIVLPLNLIIIFDMPTVI